MLSNAFYDDTIFTAKVETSSIVDFDRNAIIMIVNVCTQSICSVCFLHTTTLFVILSSGGHLRKVVVMLKEYCLSEKHLFVAIAGFELF